MNNFEVTFPDGGYVEYVPKEVKSGSLLNRISAGKKIRGGEHNLSVLELKIQVRKGIISGKQAAVAFLQSR